VTSRGAVCDVAVPGRTEIGWGGRASELSSPAAAGTMGSTLEVLIQRLWEGLWAGGAPCPLCAGQLRLRDGKGCCERCGSVLS
jgi:hypothetical protein